LCLRESEESSHTAAASLSTDEQQRGGGSRLDDTYMNHALLRPSCHTTSFWPPSSILSLGFVS